MLHAVPGLEPVQELARLLAPERVRLFDGLAIEALVGLVVQVRALAYLILERVKADFEHGGFLVLLLSRDVH